jgi:uncharacterized cupin superfamily protein
VDRRGESGRALIKRLNIAGVELDEPLDEAGFRHNAATIGPRLGARRIGASIYEAEAGTPIWPYHYHHGIEEWLYVIAGSPVLREPAGERELATGDLVCFPSGHPGAHTVRGPGRFAIFSAGQGVEPWMSVYPDSDKISGPGGILLRASAVGYWHGEGTGGSSEPAEFAREPATTERRPAVNLLALERPQQFGAGLLEGAVVDLDPGVPAEPYHCVYGREVWILVLSGSPTLRHPHGEDHLEAGDLVCRVEGPEGAHCLVNRGDARARALVLSTTGLPANVFYPDTGEWLLRHGAGADEVVRLAAERPGHVT